MSLRIRKLEAGDDRRHFTSGVIELDRFFHLYAGQNQFRHHLGTTYVAVEKDLIVGFATVTASEVTVDQLPTSLRKRLPSYPLPVLRLARLAVDERVKGLGVGSALLRAVLLLAQHMADDIGCVGVIVDAKADAVAFYKKLGFEALEAETGHLADRPQPQPMFLPIAEIARLPTAR